LWIRTSAVKQRRIDGVLSCEYHLVSVCHAIRHYKEVGNTPGCYGNGDAAGDESNGTMRNHEAISQVQQQQQLAN